MFPDLIPLIRRVAEGSSAITEQLQIDHIDRLGQVLDDLHTQRLFLVADRSAFSASGAEQAIGPFLKGRTVVQFNQFEANPKWPDVIEGVAKFKESGSDVILAIGGGTAIDVAKLVRCFAAQSGDLDRITEGNTPITTPTVPLIAIPTTAGTGSEATHFAVVYRDGQKHSVAHESILPDVALVDWRLTRSLPPQITAATGLDALCQAIESMWSVHSDEASVQFAIEAADLAFNHLAAAVNTPNDTSRAAMSRAANLAGKAINLTKTTAPHAISYSITHDFGIAHGHAVAITLGPLLEFNAAVDASNVVDSRGVAHVQEKIASICRLFNCQTSGAARLAFEQLLRSIGCAIRLGELGFGSDDQLAKIAANVNTDRLGNNPRRLSTKQIVAVLESIR